MTVVCGLGPSAALLWTVDLASGGWQEYGHFDLEHTPHRRRKRSNHQIEIVDGLCSFYNIRNYF